ncbi:MAG: hypothetical protein K9L87_02210 [Candidatus Omnitrophica bacterium]|jgi:xanthosine utilization system XapX-like protein|nr:hypothetical protein [Candidatus Omnitrophota bacterium]MCF7877284.1 hypothetical protein [Candidatus Omnitrophota bacterium]MCF7891599.1 hypothetical protein [Candidatus Omnitrophota bacterium]MCF7895901.1 hypothetical protein [Candidatus Omnitrophota bacterium]MCF7897551.1 hypothetical protein [Candidatus Omnitrophota bacterium]
MVLGIMFLLAGILIAVYPPLLSLIIAAVLIVLGVVSIYIGYQLKKIDRKSGDPFIDFFFRF